jgi:hypothetical protein
MKEMEEQRKADLAMVGQNGRAHRFVQTLKALLAKLVLANRGNARASGFGRAAIVTQI